MQFAAFVGPREVIAAGVLVVGADDPEVSFRLEDMLYVLRFEPQPGEMAVEFVREHEKRMRIHLRGPLPLMATTWKLGAVGQAGSRQIDLDLSVYSQLDAQPCARQVSFCFTAHPPGAGAA